MKILGIETSCDETAVAVVNDQREVLARAVFSQLDEHQLFGGVVPEIAARAHLMRLAPMVQKVMDEADLSYQDLDAVAATTGPGLIGGLVVGSTLGKTLSFANNLPFYAVNHLEGHALSARLIEDIDFPYLLLLVSGGHTELLRVSGVADYALLGQTIDDAAGEAFDKVAKILGLGYPGGPAVEKLAGGGDLTAIDLPRPLVGRPGCDFSFSGLKTAVHYSLKNTSNVDEPFKANVAASFQAAVGDVIVDRCHQALEQSPACQSLVVAGGVAANAYLRGRLEGLSQEKQVAFIAPPLKLCTDNAEMIAWAAIERRRLGFEGDALDAKPRPRWPLEDLNLQKDAA